MVHKRLGRLSEKKLEKRVHHIYIYISLRIANIKAHVASVFLVINTLKKQDEISRFKMHEVILNFIFIYVKRYECYEIKIDSKINKL
jgi:hypothetical protein